MFSLSGRYDKEIKKREIQVSVLENEIYQLEPLRLRIEQYKQLIETFEEEIEELKSSQLEEDRGGFERSHNTHPLTPTPVIFYD